MPLADIKNRIIHHHLHRNIGLVSLLFIGVGSTIEASIFVLLSPGAAISGRYLPFSFLLGGFLAILVSFIYAEIATSMPVSGSDLKYIFYAFNNRVVAFNLSWLVILGDLSYLALNTLGFAVYVNTFVHINPLFIASSALVIVTLINLRGIQKTSRIANLITLFLLIFIVAFIARLLVNQPISLPPIAEIKVGALPMLFTQIIAGTGLIFTTYIGYEDITSIAEEVKEPNYTIPRALVFTVLITTSIYTLIALLITSILPIESIVNSPTPLFLLADTIGWPHYIITLTAFLATLSTLVVTLLVASRKLYALSSQGFFEPIFTRINRWNVPQGAIIFCAGVTFLLIISNSIEFAAYLGNTVYLLGMIGNCAAIYLMRKKERPNHHFYAPFFPLLPLTIIVIASLLVYFIHPQAILATLIWSLFGLVVYLIATIAANKTNSTSHF